MPTIKEEIYFHLPVRFQNILVSMYGRHLANKRYQGSFQEILQNLKHIELLSKENLEALKLKKLKNMLTYASTEIPYYETLFREIGFNPAGMRYSDEITQIPILEKETIRNNPSLFLPKDIKQKQYFLQNTSGSTGKPMSIHVDETTYKTAMALLVHHEQQHGVFMGDPKATFAGRMIQKLEDNSPPFCRLNSAENQMLFSSSHINATNIATYIKELNKFRPREFIGYPSAIYALAHEMKASGQKLNFRPQIVVTNSETLLDWQREVIEEVLGCPIYDYYGTAEYLIFAGQCKNNQYHINTSLGILEVTDQKGNQVTNQEGDILGTSLTNLAMPLIRYRIGDRGIMTTDKCNCGSCLESLTSIEGRVDDVIITLDDRKIGRLDHIYKGLTGIKEAQIIQETRDNCTINIVKGNIASERIDEKQLIANMKSRVGEEMNIKINYLTEIQKSKNQKFKAVINRISKS